MTVKPNFWQHLQYLLRAIKVFENPTGNFAQSENGKIIKVGEIQNSTPAGHHF